MLGRKIALVFQIMEGQTTQFIRDKEARAFIRKGTPLKMGYKIFN